MKIYRGARTIDGIEVTVDGSPLDPRYDLARHTNAGFEWGYEGDAARQLALAILADHTGDEATAMQQSAGFMTQVVLELDNEWELTAEQIAAALNGAGLGGTGPGETA